MEIHQILTYQAEQAAQRYLGLIEAFRNIYAMAVAGGDFSTPRALSSLRDQAYGNARSFMDHERRTIGEILPQIVQEALAETREIERATTTADTHADRVTELLSATESYLESEIAVQIERDIAFMTKALRRAALEVDLAARVQGISRQAAALQWRVRNSAELRFHFRDRGNRPWPSQKFIRATWRQAMLDAYNLTVLAQLAEEGIDHAVIRHPGSNADGTIVTMLPNADHATYAELRDEVFHPNTEAVLVRPEAA